MLPTEAMLPNVVFLVSELIGLKLTSLTLMLLSAINIVAPLMQPWNNLKLPLCSSKDTAVLYLVPTFDPKTPPSRCLLGMMEFILMVSLVSTSCCTADAYDALFSQITCYTT
eukprot:15348421-Ditylum_brightwellii.AAC.1